MRRIVREELAAAFDTSAVRVERQVIEVNPQRHYSVAAVADILGVEVGWVYKRIRRGDIRVLELGDDRSKMRISTPELQRYIDSRSFGGVTQLPDPIEQYKKLSGWTGE